VPEFLRKSPPSDIVNHKIVQGFEKLSVVPALVAAPVSDRERLELVGQVLDPGRPELAGQESESTTGAEVSSLRAGAVGTKHGSWKGECWARTHMPIFVLMLAANLFVRSKRERSSGDKVVEEALFRRGIFKLDVTPLRIIAG